MAAAFQPVCSSHGPMPRQPAQHPNLELYSCPQCPSFHCNFVPRPDPTKDPDWYCRKCAQPTHYYAHDAGCPNQNL